MSQAAFLQRWGTFVRERFAPAAHLPMVAAFVAGNVAATVALTGVPLRPMPVLAAGAATLLIFFRLRIFDELKDSDTDRRLHPERPLARGLITPAEAKRVAAATSLAELLLALACGLPALGGWAAVHGYSLLMYREFGVGSWLRPRLELYAVTHTLVAGWLGLFIAAAFSGLPLWRLPAGVWGFALANWAVFNVFEFARKTRGAEEEEPAVASYSARLRPAGAVALAVSMVAVAAATARVPLRAASLGEAAATAVVAALLLVPAAGALPYLCRPRRRQAALYRGVMQLFIVGFYLALAAAIFAGRSGP